MAIYPCDVSGHPYRGPQQTMYPAVVDGGQAFRRKLRLCPGHFDTYAEMLARRCQNAQIDFMAALEVTCFLCQKPVTESAAQLFVTVYRVKSEREDFWAPLHEQCIEATLDDWFIEPVAS